ncbi:hypothetical protein A8990_14318 [Paenibacillus taihuensis]|uniref:Uncharacterized protein n=1 Tax=Paenibacillus taihuensis TaxID=1156355 RepID=A0A3D9R399_9BACL|nr:hypothetical protein A8990_14318 [Paenibacillus taihuensis]
MKHAINSLNGQCELEKRLIRTYPLKLESIRCEPDETLRKFSLYLYVITGYIRMTGKKPTINNVLRQFREHF